MRKEHRKTSLISVMAGRKTRLAPVMALRTDSR
jgi:hypothetical protein